MTFTGAANAWFLKEFYQDIAEETDPGNAFRIANTDAAKAEPGCGGVVFLPYMLGERSPIWDAYARSVFYGVSVNTTRCDMNRAVLESCGYGLKQMCEIAEKLIGRSIKGFSSIGGGAKSGVWAQIKADITGRTITVLDMNDMAPVGAALLAGVGIGHFSDVYEASEKVERDVYREFVPTENKKVRKIYDNRYDTYRKLYPLLKDLYREDALKREME